MVERVSLVIVWDEPASRLEPCLNRVSAASSGRLVLGAGKGHTIELLGLFIDSA